MRCWSLIFLLLAWPGLVRAQTTQEAKVAAATSNAVAGLLADISRQPISNDLSVREFLVATHGTDAMAATLKQADQIGGPRWIDELTCQVRLEISGAKVVDSLLRISASAGDKSPVKDKALRAALRGWDRRTFSVLGNSGIEPVTNALTPATQAAKIALPTHPPAWVGQYMNADGRNGPERTKLRAARAAETKALAQLRVQINDLPVTADATVGKAASADTALDQAIDRAVQKAKLTKLDYLADGSAAVKVTLNLADVWREIEATRQDPPAMFP